MAIALAVTSILAVISIAAAFNYRRQITKICLQVRYINNHDTNMIVSSIYGNTVDKELADEINKLIFRCRELEKEYSNKETNLKDSITNLSHDIRTPLTSLDGYFQLLNESDSQSDQEKYLAVIRERISSLTMMLDELFTYAKLQDDSYVMDMERIVLNKLLYETAFSFYDDFKLRGIEPVIEITEKTVVVDGNYAALKRAIQNIIKNSLDHGKNYFFLNLESKNNKAIISIKNQRSDMENTDITHVFDRFYKSDISRSKTSTGLGLSIAKEIIEKNFGEIEAVIENEMFEVKISLHSLMK